jgi:hypothetical protein
VKRTAQIRLLLAGTLACVPFAGCDLEDNTPPVVSTENTYTNNYYVPGSGYYHAPYRSWFPYPYNHYEAGRGYFHGGNWTSEPQRSTETASRPNADAVSHINQTRKSSSGSSSISRNGFGHSSHHSFS